MDFINSLSNHKRYHIKSGNIDSLLELNKSKF